jgi:putative hydrolase of the HAD superfamily
MVNHGIDPHEYLEFVHRIDHSPIRPDARLDRALSLLPGRKLVFTNGSVDHAAKVMGRLGVARHFSDVFDIAAAKFTPKPEPEPYRALLARHDIRPERAVMIDDMPRNLEPAAALGMTTVWVRTDVEWAQPPAETPFIHHVTDDLPAWLESRSNPTSATRTGTGA